MKRSFRAPAFRRRLLCLGAVFFFCAPWFPAAAEITLDKAEMASLGRMKDDEFTLSSLVSADIALTGGYKYGFLLGLSLDARTGLDDPAGFVPFFRTAKATARDISGLPLEISYFLGAGDDFCTGDWVSARTGLPPSGTEFKGFYYFSDSIRYDGIYGARGTGLSFALTRWEKIVPLVYIYQNFDIDGLLPGPGSGGAGNVFGSRNFYSGDLRVLLHQGALRLEAFWGVSWDPGLETDVRGGLMFHAAGQGMEFFAQAGIPGWQVDSGLSIDNLFFLIEPRLHFRVVSLILTFFYHPAVYLHYPTGEQGWADINLKIQTGNAGTGFSGGVETGGQFRNGNLEDFVLVAAPYVGISTGGLRWDAKFQIKPLEIGTPAEMFGIFLGVRTAF